MIKEKQKRINRVFSRLMVVFLIIIIPIYVLGIYMYQWSFNSVKNEIAKSTLAQASFYLEKLENEIERIKILQYDCLNDEDLNKLAIRSDVMDYYDIVMSMRQLQQRLVTINNSSEYIHNVSAHIRPIGKTISSEAGIIFFDDDKFFNIRVPDNFHGAQILNYQNDLYLSTFQDSLTKTDPLYIIEVELAHDTITEELEQFTTYEGSQSLLADNLNNNLIASTGAADTTFTDYMIDSLGTTQNDSVSTLLIENKEYYLVNVSSDYLNMQLIWYIPVDLILQPLQNFNIWFWLFTVVSLFMIFIFSFYVYKTMHKPMRKLMSSFKEMETGNFDVTIQHDAKNEFGYIYRRFNSMTYRLKMLIDQVYNQKILMQRAEMKQLQSQINPHFLYNSMFMLNTMVRLNDENLTPFTQYLGEYFRYITRNTSDYASLIDEVNHAKVYVKIQLLRFSKRIKIRFDDLPDAYSQVQVPRLILQPLIENAFEHGIEKKAEKGMIVIRYKTSHPDYLDIIVEDNGHDLTDETIDSIQENLATDQNNTEVTGVINIHRRIKLFYGDQYGLFTERSELGGLKITVRIKITGGD